MSKKAKALIREAVKLYRDEDGASEFGSYRDVVTDVLHLFRADVDATGACPQSPSGPDIRYVLDEGFVMYLDERRTAERKHLDEIPDKELPLHLDDVWEFDENRVAFHEKLTKMGCSVES